MATEKQKRHRWYHLRHRDIERAQLSKKRHGRFSRRHGGLVRGHYAPYWYSRARYFLRRIRASKKKGEVIGFKTWMLSGRPGNINAATKRYIARGVAAGLYCTSTTTGGHAPSSYHFPRNNSDGVGHAADMAGGLAKMIAFQKAELKQDHLELFGPDNYANEKFNQRITLSEGSSLEQMHDNHVHGAQN